MRHEANASRPCVRQPQRLPFLRVLPDDNDIKILVHGRSVFAGLFHVKHTVSFAYTETRENTAENGVMVNPPDNAVQIVAAIRSSSARRSSV